MSKWLEGLGVRKEWMLDRQTGRTSEKEIENSVLLTRPGRRSERECVFSQKEKVCKLEAQYGVRSCSVVDSSKCWVVMVRIPWYGVPSTLMPGSRVRMGNKIDNVWQD